MEKDIVKKNILDINVLKATEPKIIDKLRRYDAEVLKCIQLKLNISHSIHADVYSRTLELKKGTLITGVLIKIETNLIISGDVIMILDENKFVRFSGYHVLKCEAHRKQMFFAKSDSYMTMYFSTKAKKIKEAEREFTDEYMELLK